MAQSKPVLPESAIVDIGGSKLQNGVVDRLKRCLTAVYKPGDLPTLPDELLYDDQGLLIWNDIMSIPEFYQTHDEVALFKANGADLAEQVSSNVTIVDLGAGDTRKVEHLLLEFEKAKKPAKYLALDISKASLDQNVAYLILHHSKADSVVDCGGLWGTFQDGMEHVESIKGPRLFLSLGSVLCNDPWYQALTHLRGWAKVLREDDLLLVGMDAHLITSDRSKIWASYHSCDDLYRKFFLNGFDHANKLVGEKWFREEDWDFKAELQQYPTTRHRFYFAANKDVILGSLGKTFKKGEEIDWFDSHKYGEEAVRLMCTKAGLVVISVWQAPDSQFRQYLLRTRLARDEIEDGDSAVSGLN